MLSRFLSNAGHPFRALRRFLEIVVKGVPDGDPDAVTRELFLAYSSLSKAQGFDQLYLALSFDCDTPEDVAAAEQLHPWLAERGIKATYAVPGVLLKQNANVYRRISKAGGDFINHGALSHAEWRDGRYWSTTFYHEMTPLEVANDIRQGHEIVRQIIGETPTGFRAPHFGLFQLPQQREIVYATLRELGYRYSTSTLPELAMKNGPLVDVGGLIEIPLSGSYATPLSILDSWGNVESALHPVVKESYAARLIETVTRILDLRVCGVLNYYVDPAHVQSASSFYRAMDFLIERQVPTLQYGEILDRVKMK